MFQRLLPPYKAKSSQDEGDKLMLSHCFCIKIISVTVLVETTLADIMQLYRASFPLTEGIGVYLLSHLM